MYPNPYSQPYPRAYPNPTLTLLYQFDGVYGGFFLEGSGSSESKFAPSKKAPKAKKAPRKNPFEGLKNLKKGKKAE